jgi:hypothetical protein
LLEKIDDIPIVHLTEEFSLNKSNQAIVQIFITHFFPLLVLHTIHRGKTLSTLAVPTERISTNLRSL